MTTMTTTTTALETVREFLLSTDALAIVAEAIDAYRAEYGGGDDSEGDAILDTVADEMTDHLPAWMHDTARELVRSIDGAELVEWIESLTDQTDPD